MAAVRVAQNLHPCSTRGLGIAEDVLKAALKHEHGICNRKSCGSMVGHTKNCIAKSSDQRTLLSSIV